MEFMLCALPFQFPTESNLYTDWLYFFVFTCRCECVINDLSLSFCPCRCVWRSLCIGMEYSADSKLDDRECRQASHAHTLITGVQWLLLQTSAGFHPFYDFTSYFFKLDSSFLDFWTPFVSCLTPPFPFSLFSPSPHLSSLSPLYSFPVDLLIKFWPACALRWVGWVV